jgi:signal transduction histidine kinase
MRTSRGIFLVASAGILAIGAAAWVQAGRDPYRALSDQGATIARTLAEGARTALDAVEALEAALASRLETAGRRLDRALPSDAAEAAPLLAEFRREEGLERIWAFRADGTLAAAAPGPAVLPADGEGAGGPAERAALDEEEDAAAEAEALLDSGKPLAVRGLAANPFGTRTRFGVAVRRAAGRGALVLRAAADEVRALRSRVGLETLLRRAGDAPGVLGVSVADAAGRTLASAGAAPPAAGAAAGAVASTPTGRAFLVSAPFEAGEVRGATIALHLATAPIDAVVAGARRSVALATAAALFLALGSLALLERARRRAEEEERERSAREERDRRLASLGELGAGVAHEIRNPLNAIDLTVQRMAREVRAAGDEDRARLAEMTATIRREVKGLDRLVDSFLRFARSPDPRLERQDVAAAVRAEAGLFAAEAAERGVRVEVREEGPAPAVLLDGALFAQALRNLLRNALEASPSGAAVEVLVGREGDRARVEVRDRGPGVPAAERDRIFEILHTTREGGTGLGLPLALRSVRKHGGTIEVRDAPGGGACFAILLPAAEGRG